MLRDKLTVGQALCHYLEDSLHLAETTRRKFRYEIGRWIRFCGDTPISDITEESLRSFIVACRGAGLREQTAAANVGTLLTLLRYAVRKGWLDRTPTFRVVRRASVRAAPGVPELGALYDACRRTELKWPTFRWVSTSDFWRAWIAVSVLTGARLGDLMYRLRWSQVSDSELWWSAGKTGKAHRIPMHPVLKSHLELVRRPLSNCDDRIFPISKSPHLVRRELYRLCDVAGVRRYGAQAFRRAAVQLYEQAHPGAGAILQGSGLRGSLGYYVDPITILHAAQRKLELPESFYPPDERATRRHVRTRLLKLVARLRHDQQEALVRVCESMQNA
ncbi:MAG: site-specific integrase [Planctomycetes bacterium]|nr:site-specific integrase [Planctomycetota bacterium]